MGGSSHSQTFLLDTWNNRDGPTRKMEVMVGQNDWVTWSNILIDCDWTIQYFTAVKRCLPDLSLLFTTIYSLLVLTFKIHN